MMRTFVVSGLAAAVCAVMIVAGCTQKTTPVASGSVPPPAAAKAPAEEPQAKAEERGSADAKVYLRAFYPGNDAHKPTRDVILSMADKFPGKVKVRVVPFDASDEYYKEWTQDAGLTCGGVLIDGKQTFSLKKSGKLEEVTFKMRMGGEWQQEDLEQAVTEEVGRMYPK